MPIFFFVSLVTYICYICFKCSTALIELQNAEFNSKKYLAYIKNNIKKIFWTPEILTIILIVIVVNADEKVAGISTVVLYMFLSLYLIVKKKDKLKFNKNTFLVILGIVIFYLLLFGYITYDYYISHSSVLIFDFSYVYYILIILVGYFIYYLILLSNVIVNFLKRVKNNIINKRRNNNKAKKNQNKRKNNRIISTKK